jgi:hypothetical protein
MAAANRRGCAARQAAPWQAAANRRGCAARQAAPWTAANRRQTGAEGVRRQAGGSLARQAAPWQAAGRRCIGLYHAGKMLYRFSKAGYGLVGVAVYNALFNAMIQMPFKYNLPCLVYSFFNGVYLNKDVFAGNILINHLVYCLYLPQNSIQPFVQIL